jgi:hypothetical protein
MDKKNIIILVLSIALSFFIFNWFTDKPKNLDTNFLESQINSLNTKNNNLLIDIKYHNNKSLGFKYTIDSLLNVKPKINIRYVTKYKEIDNSSVFELISMSDSIFHANGIK